MSEDDPCAPLTIGDVAPLTVVPHGGQVLGWTPAGSAVSRLWLSPDHRCGPGAAIRGGIPVIFPQFSDRGPLPKHGLARDRAWQPLSFGAVPGMRADGELELRDDAATREVWPRGFRVAVRATAFATALDVELEVRNTGAEDLEFTAALHSYLTVGGAGATIRGLEGLPAEDNAAGRAAVTMPGAPLDALEPRDVAVRGATSPVVLDDPELGPLAVTATGFTDVVVWNPGPGHGLPDVPDGGEREFVCIEPALLTSEVLAPGWLWRGSMRLSVRP
jgi:glucose-6-phosphate 1-epimerase